MLIVHIGSKNPQKITAVREVFEAWGVEAALFDRDVASGVTDQPMSLETTYTGAMNRARAALLIAKPNANEKDFHIGVGLESGLFKLIPSENTWMDIGVCAFLVPHPEGERWAYGLSNAFAIPDELVQIMQKEGCDLSQAVLRAGLTTHEKIGASEGLISILSKGRVIRRDQIRSSIQSAMIQLDTLL